MSFLRFAMRGTYSEQFDALYISLRDIEPGGAAHTIDKRSRAFPEIVNFDYDAEGYLIGIEIINGGPVDATRLDVLSREDREVIDHEHLRDPLADEVPGKR